MNKITLIGAGSTVFSKNILGDCMLTPALQDFEFALFDIDEQRLKDSELMLNNLKYSVNSSVHIQVYKEQKEALRGAKYVINAIQVGGYDPCTITDFEIPKKYGLRQTIADTIGIGGIFRTLRTTPVLQGIAEDMQEVCPEAWFLNYTNPMAALTKFMNDEGGMKTVGLCHSVQSCVPELLDSLGLSRENVQSSIAGINHMAWLLDIRRDGKDLYPEIKHRAAEKQKHTHDDMVRFELMQRFGYYVTESSEHSAEYHPYFIKSRYPELIGHYNIFLDEYPRRCEEQINSWNTMRDGLIHDNTISHERSGEYAAGIMEAMENDHPFRIGGNVMNTGGLISNLPENACVEVPCLVDKNGIRPTHVGALPEQLAALNRTNINTQLLTVKAAVSRKKDDLYQAAMLDPHTAAELSIDDIYALCNDLIEAHGSWLPTFH